MKPTSVRGLLKQFVGPTYRDLISASLEAVGLDEQAKGVAACSNVKQIEPLAIVNEGN